MKIDLNKTDDRVTVALEGRLDTITAPELEAALTPALEGTKELTLDFAGVEYLSSAGLRVLLSAQKVMNRQGSMKLTHVCASVLEIFEVTGFSDILTIEQADGDAGNG